MRPPGVSLVKTVAGATVELGRRAERDARAAASDAARWATLTVLDGILASSVAGEATERVLASQWAERTVVQVVDEERAHRALAAALASPAVERAVAQVIDSRLADDAVARIVDRTLARLTDNPALWDLVEAVAASPAVRAALTQQSAGFAEELADDVRGRSRQADDQLEHAARRLLHWRRSTGPVPEAGA